MSAHTIILKLEIVAKGIRQGAGPAADLRPQTRAASRRDHFTSLSQNSSRLSRRLWKHRGAGDSRLLPLALLLDFQESTRVHRHIVWVCVQPAAGRGGMLVLRGQGLTVHILSAQSIGPRVAMWSHTAAGGTAYWGSRKPRYKPEVL